MRPSARASNSRTRNAQAAADARDARAARAAAASARPREPGQTADVGDAAATRVDLLARLFVVLGPLYRRVARRVEQDVAALGVTVGVRAILDMLSRDGPMTVPEMGRAQGLSRQFVQRTVNLAAAQRLVKAVPNPKHQRSMLIQLTPQGIRKMAAIRARERKALRALASELTAAQLATCVQILEVLGQAFAHVSMDD